MASKTQHAHARAAAQERRNKRRHVRRVESRLEAERNLSPLPNEARKRTVTDESAVSTGDSVMVGLRSGQLFEQGEERDPPRRRTVTDETAVSTGSHVMMNLRPGQLFEQGGERDPPRKRTTTDETAVSTGDQVMVKFRPEQLFEQGGERDAPRKRTVTEESTLSTASDTTAVSIQVSVEPPKSEFQPVFDVVVLDSNVYQHRSPYNPEVYKCTNYREESYEYFDGMPGRDDRFTIDLEGGSTDHLRDVRPYLYYVGFWAQKTRDQPDVEKAPDASAVEDGYVKAGRQYLINERAKKHGYFLADRDWKTLNEGGAYFPFYWLARADPEDGDQGCDEGHDMADFRDDTCGCVVKTNIRTPLPSKDEVRCRPEDEDWDDFIIWLYHYDLHGLPYMVNYGVSILEVIRERKLQLLGYRQWLSDGGDDS